MTPAASGGEAAGVGSRTGATLAWGAAGALTLAGVGYAAARGYVAWRRSHAAVDPELELPEGVVHHHLSSPAGGEVHAVELGSGPPVVLLHGAGLAADVWAYQLRDLSADHRVVAVDLRGHGGSTLAPEPVAPDPSGRPAAGTAGDLTISAMADDVAVALEVLGIDGAVLAGHSMGGMVALRMLRDRPELAGGVVAAVAFVSTSAGLGLAVPAWETLARTIGRAAGSGATRVQGGRPSLPRGDLGYLASRLGFGRDPRPEQVAATLAMLRATPSAVFRALWPEVLAFEERAPYATAGLPVAVAVGSADRLTPPLYARRIAAGFEHAVVHEFVGAGHMLMYERRDALDDLLEQLAVRAARGPSRRRSSGRASP